MEIISGCGQIVNLIENWSDIIFIGKSEEILGM